MAIYVSIDIETDGPCPGVHSMRSLGAVGFDEDGKERGSFLINFEPIPNGLTDPSTMQFWNRNPEAWAKATANPVEPWQAIAQFRGWIESLRRSPSESVVAIAYPAGFDFSFVYFYLLRFGGRSPLGFSCLDIKTYAMAALEIVTKMPAGYRSTVKKTMPHVWFKDLPKHTHVATDDALEQGLLFFNIRRWIREGGKEETCES
jgi:hypothetical protein